jgi:hypothetical protein
MAGLLAAIKKKPKARINTGEEHHNPYAVALQFPEESERLFDGDLKLLLMDGLLNLFYFCILIQNDGSLSIYAGHGEIEE